MSKVGSWSTTPGSNNSTPPDGWPEGQAPSTVNDCAREMMAAIRAVFNDAQYFDQNLSPTYISATSFSVTGDNTSAIHAGRRLKLYDATTVYATVTTATFTAVTTIHISADAATLTSSLSSFAVAILSKNNDSFPRNLAVSLSAGTVGGYAIGYKEAPPNVISGAYECVVGDSGKVLIHPRTDTTARTWTIPSNATVSYATGTVLTFANQLSAGNLTIAITNDTMRIAGTGSAGPRSLAAAGMASAIKIDTTEWMINGTGLT